LGFFARKKTVSGNLHCNESFNNNKNIIITSAIHHIIIYDIIKKEFVKKYYAISLFDQELLKVKDHGLVLLSSNSNHFIIFRDTNMLSFTINVKDDFNIINLKIIENKQHASISLLNSFGFIHLYDISYIVTFGGATGSGRKTNNIYLYDCKHQDFTFEVTRVCV